MAPRAKKVDGDSYISTEPDARGYYNAFVSMGLGSDGKPDRRHVMRKDLKAVRARVRELERDRDAGKVSKKGRQPTVREMLERHLDVTLAARGRAPKTIYSYRSICERQIFPMWGSHRIDQLRDEHIEDGIAQLLADGKAPSSVRKVLAILSSAYELQVERGLVARNPCSTVHPPALGPSKQTALTEAEALAIFRVATGRENAARWSVGMACGLRQGEALGLRWSFLNLDVPEGMPGEMRVWWQLQRLPWVHGCADEAVKSLRDPAERKQRIREIELACAEPWHKRP